MGSAPAFCEEEYQIRLARTRERLGALGLDGLLAFAPETHYWLTGFETFGYCFFQCLVVGADGTLVLLTRAPDRLQALETSMIRDVRVWEDREGADPAGELAALLWELGFKGGRLGVEWAAHGLTAADGRALERALSGRVELVDASGLVDRLRLVKSNAELAYVREAAQLADRALDAALAEARPGAEEARILARMQAAVLEAGGDYPANPFIIGSGRRALLCRYASGRRRLAERDRLTLEFAGVMRHYHACLMRTVVVGAPDEEDRRWFAACREALLRAEERLYPGVPMDEVFRAQARVLDELGFREQRLHACGYPLGARFAPSWMETPLFCRGTSLELAPGMVVFLHIILADQKELRAMTLGRTSLVTADGPEILSRAPLELPVAGG